MHNSRQRRRQQRKTLNLNITQQTQTKKYFIASHDIRSKNEVDLFYRRREHHTVSTKQSKI